jgi:hypothetical protein
LGVIPSVGAGQQPDFGRLGHELCNLLSALYSPLQLAKFDFTSGPDKSLT